MLLDNIAIHSLWKVFRQRLYNIVFRQVLTKSIFSLLDGKNDQQHQEPKIESVFGVLDGKNDQWQTKS